MRFRRACAWVSLMRQSQAVASEFAIFGKDNFLLRGRSRPDIERNAQEGL